MKKKEYPYLPDGKEIKHVPVTDSFMLAAKEAQEELSGDQIYPIGLVYVRDGEILARGGNGFAKGGSYIHICPRIVHECKSGEGYDLCHHHDPDGHSEAMGIKDAESRGVDLTGADAYMYGHYWACKPCWDKMLAVGINDLYVLEGAEEYFARGAVHERTIGSPNIKTVYISGGLTKSSGGAREVFTALKEACGEVGVDAYCPHEHSDPQIKAKEDQPADGLSAEEIYKLDYKRILEHDVLVAYIGEPSTGTGVELEMAHQAGKPIVLLSEKGNRVSRMARGVPSVVYHIEFESIDDAKRKLQQVLKQL